MTVICIKNGEWISEQIGVSKKCNPSFGEPCTVVKENKDAYEIEEYPLNELGNPQQFLKKWFIPSSSIDETEMIREYKKELV